MRKYENLGKTLDKQDQKSISGGIAAFSNLMCATTSGGPFSFIASYASKAICNANMGTYCYDDGPYIECYCTGDSFTRICDL